MSVGFFPRATVGVRESPVPTTPRCSLCGLYRSCNSPKMPVTGQGKYGVLVVAEAPGATEDRDGVQLVGKSGQKLREVLRRFDVDLDRHCFKTNAVICRPEGNPTDEQIEYCRPCLNKTIEELKPYCIILLGAAAVKSLIGQLWRRGEDPGGIGRWVGWQIPSQQLNTWICPTYHPSYILRSNEPVLELWFARHLEGAFQVQLKGRPWPDGFKCDSIEVIYEPERAAKRVRQMIARGGRVSFDYETNMLKPDGPSARIVSCAVCWEGKKTVAFPWHGEAVGAVSELLLNPLIGKIGYNCKFESRFTRALLGHGVRNWIFDGMLGAHVLDHRPGVTSLDFQAFVQLGIKPWGDEVSPYFSSEQPNAPNRIKEVDLGALLKYNGLDALITFKLAEKQMRDLGINSDAGGACLQE